MKIEKEKIYYLAGGTGTEILRRGFPTKLPLWSAQVLFDNPELLKQIYIDYIEAGADIITTNTFRTQRRTLAKVGLSRETERINRLAVNIAVEARNEAKAKRPVYIAGCVTTLEDCYRPDLLPTEREMKTEHREQVQLLADTPIDFFLLETFNSFREAIIVAEEVYSTGKSFAVSFTTNEAGDILNGDRWKEAIDQLSKFHPIAILVNCVQGGVASKALNKIKKVTSLPFGAYGNGAGEADNKEGWKFTTADQIENYLHHCSNWVDLGATIIGGCCGTNPDYTRAYSQLKRR
ncbi:MAG: homocysteine S-methyltransferase family protein [Candidatus Taylorbacteria bacterium]